LPPFFHAGLSAHELGVLPLLDPARVASEGRAAGIIIAVAPEAAAVAGPPGAPA
jgi:hypothetical protein